MGAKLSGAIFSSVTGAGVGEATVVVAMGGGAVPEFRLAGRPSEGAPLASVAVSGDGWGFGLQPAAPSSSGAETNSENTREKVGRRNGMAPQLDRRATRPVYFARVFVPASLGL
jgi:hypothetical protein